MKSLKKLLALILCLAMLAALAGCGKSEAVKNTESLISAIGEVTVDSEEAIVAAEEALAALSEEERGKVENVSRLSSAREALTAAYARAVDEQIAAIGEVTADSGDLIAAAEEALAALSVESRAMVENAAALTEARAALERALEEKAAAELEALRQSLLGFWKVDLDQTDSLVSSVDEAASFEGLSFSDYLDSFVVTYVLELNDDGSFRLYLDPDALDASLVSVKASTVRYYDNVVLLALAKAFAAEGYDGDLSSWEAIEQLTELSKEEIIQRGLGMSLEEFVDQLFNNTDGLGAFLHSTLRSGRFTVEPGKLHMIDGSEEPSDDVYEVFTLDGDTLVFTEFVGEYLYDEFEYPIEFHRAG